MKFDLNKIKEMAVEAPADAVARIKERSEEREWLNYCATLALRIRRELRLKNMTQAGLAEKLGVTPAMVSRYLSGKHNLELKTIFKIEKALGINIISTDSQIATAQSFQTFAVTQAVLVNAVEQNIVRSRRYSDANEVSTHFYECFATEQELKTLELEYAMS